jgi:DNA-binding CsgD family transcriptional regulator/sugar-specific transcriptional regulator TrmB
MFEALGLNPTTESVYLAMLELPEASLAELARRLDLDRAQLLDALDDLARMSLLHRPVAGPEPVRLVDPEVALAALLARQQTEVARRQQEIEESRAAFSTLLAARAEQHPRVAEPGVDRLVGIDAIRARLRELAQTCTWEACSFMPGGAQSASSLAASRPLDADAINRGVRLRTVYQDSVRNDPGTREYAEWLGELGSEVRTAPTLPLRMLIVDREYALVPVNADNSAAMALTISGTGIVSALYALFDGVWREATPFGAPRRRDDNGLSEQERQVLRLLGEGHTDEVIARRLGISVRTARRVAANLLARLGARSRFQAGVLAVSRCWIESSEID